MFKTGQIIEIFTPAHAYTHMGYTDPKCIISEKTESFRIARVGKNKDGDVRLTLRPSFRLNTAAYGCAVLVEGYKRLHPGATFTVVD